MVSIFDGNPHKTIAKLAESLKEIIKTPEWAKYVKTGMSKERLPENQNWYITRAAAILRTVYIRGPIGVEKLRNKYGSKKNRGHQPEKFFKASGKIIRSALQQLEKAGFIEQKIIKGHKGRVITPKGKSFVDKNTVK
jgi:small subunit ribosomal protein S19e